MAAPALGGDDAPPAKKARAEDVPLVALLGNATRHEGWLREHFGGRARFGLISLDQAAAAAAGEVATAAVVVLTGVHPQVNSFVRNAPSLRLLQTVSTGVEFIDFAGCPGSVTVCNSSAMEHGIAEYVLGAMLHWQIQLAAESARFREEKAFVPPFRFPGCPLGPLPFHAELRGKTVGLVGTGSIGMEVAKRARAFGVRLMAVARRQRPEPPEWLDWYGTTVDLGGMLAECHFVVVCCALGPETRGLVSRQALASMRPDAVLINVARGAVVDEDALYEALVARRIRGAVLDVWWRYPSQEEPEVLPSRHPFHELENVVMTPHTSGWTHEHEERKHKQIIHNIEQALEGRSSYEHVCRAASAAGPD